MEKKTAMQQFLAIHEEKKADGLRLGERFVTMYMGKDRFGLLNELDDKVAATVIYDILVLRLPVETLPPTPPVWLEIAKALADPANELNDVEKAICEKFQWTFLTGKDITQYLTKRGSQLLRPDDVMWVEYHNGVPLTVEESIALNDVIKPD